MLLLFVVDFTIGKIYENQPLVHNTAPTSTMMFSLKSYRRVELGYKAGQKMFMWQVLFLSNVTLKSKFIAVHKILEKLIILVLHI